LCQKVRGGIPPISDDRVESSFCWGRHGEDSYLGEVWGQWLQEMKEGGRKKRRGFLTIQKVRSEGVGQPAEREETSHAGKRNQKRYYFKGVERGRREKG